MQAPPNPSRTTKHRSRPTWVGTIWTFSVFTLVRTLWRGRAPTTEHKLSDDSAILWDARGSMRCGNPARSWRVLSEWLRSRGDVPEDYEWLFARIFNWDAQVISRLTESRVTRLLSLRRSAEVLDVATQRLRLDPRFRPQSAADTLTLAQIAARSGAQRISRILLSDFSARFPGDPRVPVSEALKRRLDQLTPARMRA
jgi:hypothetical protein